MKILYSILFSIYFTTILFSLEVTVKDEVNTYSYYISASTGGCNSCTIMLPEENIITDYSTNTCTYYGAVVPSSNFDEISCEKELINTFENCVEEPNGVTETQCYIKVLPSAYYTLTYECGLLPEDAPIIDGVQWLLDSNICEYYPPCTDTLPEGAISYPSDDLGGCLSYDLLSDYQKTIYSSSGFQMCGQGPCFASSYDATNCNEPNILDTTVLPNTCSLPTCDPVVGSTAIPIQESMCIDTATIIKDGAGTNYRELVWQSCDSTCYGVPFSFLSCAELIASYQTSYCPTGEQVLLNCSEVDGMGLIDLTSLQCVPPTNPCDTLYNNVSNSCIQEGYKVVGYADCTHNGVTVTNDTIKCVQDLPDVLTESDCEYDWYAEFNIVTATCDCIDGYTRNSWGECWKNLDINATQEEIEADKLAQDESGQDSIIEELDANATLAAAVSDDITNDILTGIRSDLNSSNDTLLGIRSDLNTTNDLLSELADNFSNDVELEALDDFEQELIDFDLWVNAIETEFTDFKNNVDSQLSDIDYQFNSTKSFFEIDRDFAGLSGDSSGCVSFVYNGKSIDIDLCTPLSIFAPIVYFVTVLMFMIYAFNFTVTHLLRGLE